MYVDTIYFRETGINYSNEKRILTKNVMTIGRIQFKMGFFIVLINRSNYYFIN
jgi:hypothetical protein